MVTKLMDRGNMVVEAYQTPDDAAITVDATTLTDTRGFTPSGAGAYWAGARVYCGTASAGIGTSTATVLTLDEAWSTGVPDNGLGYTIIRDHGSQYRYANQVYTVRTEGTSTDTAIWAMPTLSLPDTTSGAVGFIKADVIATTPSGTILPDIARWYKEASFKWLHTGWQANTASFIDVGLDRSFKEFSMLALDCSLRLNTSNFYPTLYVNGAGLANVDFQATIDFAVYSIA